MSDLNRPVLRVGVKVAAETEAGRFVTAAGAAPTAEENALGPVYMKTPADGRAVVTALGTATVISAAAVALGDALEVTADGRVQPRTSTHVIVARALEAATAGQEIEALIIPN